MMYNRVGHDRWVGFVRKVSCLLHRHGFFSDDSRLGHAARSASLLAARATFGTALICAVLAGGRCIVGGIVSIIAVVVSITIIVSIRELSLST